jgi:hypothetical protein
LKLCKWFVFLSLVPGTAQLAGTKSREQARKDRKRDGLDNWLFYLLTHQFSVASSIYEVSVKLNIL